MLNYLILSLIFALTTQGACPEKTNSINETSSQLISIEVKVVKRGAWCGGMRPTDEMMQEIRSPKPIIGTTFYIKKGEVNGLDTPIFKTVITDQDGIIRVDLPEGNYIFVNEDKKDKATYNAYVKKASAGFGAFESFDLTCYDNWFGSPDGNLLVNDTSSSFTVSYTERCRYSPCMKYTGPYPP